MANEKIKYWDIRNVLAKHCLYNVIFGLRSNGKTYGTLKHSMEEYFSTGGEIAYVRRMEEDLRGGNASTLFNPFLEPDKNGKNVIEKLSKGKYNSVFYWNRRWYFEYIDHEYRNATTHKEDEKDTSFREDKPFCYAFAISAQEHYKSTSYPRITNVIFDEFLTRGYYLPNEFTLFSNLLSTIIRQRDDVTIWMLGNTVNKYAPYFADMGLTDIDKMVPGDIRVYTYGDTGLSVAVEYSDMPSKNKPSDKYFAFNNPHLKMITNGSWEIDIYPHLPITCHYKPREVLYMYFIKFSNVILQCNIIMVDGQYITYIHRKTSEIKDDGIYMVYQQESDPRPNYRRYLTKPTLPIEQKLVMFFKRDKVFYQDNEVGEVVRNYLQWCRQ